MKQKLCIYTLDLNVDLMQILEIRRAQVGNGKHV